MEPKAFFEFSKELHQLCQNPNSGFSESFQTRQDFPEIIYRTIANRSYYYLYHEVKPVLIDLIKSDPDILQELNKISISQKKIDEIFSYHANIIIFFRELEELFEENNIERLKNKAQYVVKVINSYKVIREFADYQIGITEKEVETPTGSLKINFRTPSLAVVDYLTEDIEEAKEDIIELIKKISNEIKNIIDFYYVQEIRDIIERLEKLSRRRYF